MATFCVATAVRFSLAGSTRSPVPAGGEIRTGERMAAGAMCFPGVFASKAVASSHILLMRDRFEMIRPHTCGLSAKVVEL